MAFPNTAVSTGAALQLLPPQGGTGGNATNNYLNLGFGSFTVNGVTPVTVVDAGVTANSVIVPTLKTVGGTVSASLPAVLTITPGTGFTVGGLASDTSTYNYLRFG